MKHAHVCALWLAALLPAAGIAAEPGTIRQAGFEQFAKGTLGNAGANLYVSRSGRVQVINKWDLNRDGYNDVLISNDHDDFEIVDAFVYWGSDQGFRSLLPDLWERRPLAQVLFDLMDRKEGLTRLPAFGGGRSIIADLNRDGYPEIVFCNYIHNYPGVRTAYLYWGGPDGYSIKAKTELPTKWAAGVAAADLNGDGYPELVFANQGVEAGLESISRMTGLESYIYWGSATGFDSEHPTLVPSKGAVDVTIADVDHDGRPDLAFLNNSPQAKGVQVFFGGPKGYGERQQSVAIDSPTSIRSGDLDKDGFADLVVTTAVKRQTVSLVPGAQAKAQGERSLTILPGSAAGIADLKMVRPPARVARDPPVADFNGDGFLDIAVANNADGDKGAVASYVYWGSARGFAAERRAELPTLGATGVASADLNGDGRPDLVFSNSHDDHTTDVPSYVYWGSPTGFAPYLRSDLTSFGAASVNAGDLNGDGKPEVILVNQYSGAAHGRVNTEIFWGNPHHNYSTASLTLLPGHGAYDTTVADLNDDGFPDLVICNSYSQKSYIYWGSRAGYSVAKRSEVPSGSAIVSSAVDLDRDGYLDLLFTGTASGHGVATIVWGSAQGYGSRQPTLLDLKTTRSTSHAVADTNRDGYLDLVFQDDYGGTMHIFWGGPEGYSESRTWSRFVSGGPIELADLNGDGRLDFVIAGGFDPQNKSHNTKTRIFWGTAEGTPSAEPAYELEAYSACEAGVSDLNRDGWLDIVTSNYMSDSTRSLPMFIYWGGPGGSYSKSRRTELPAESSCGVQTLDLNRDGYPEIVIHNHLKDGRHTINSYIYWNGPQGFDRTRKTELPTFGPHYSQWTDPGNQYSRTLEEEYVSAPMEVPAGRRAGKLRWQAEEPHGAKLRFQIRSAPTREGLAKAAWSGPSGAGSYYGASGADVDAAGWLQYRALFTSPDAGEWPSLSEVAVELK
jgi:hypothetical protein